MKLSTTPGTLKRLRRVPWRFQKTFHTPLQKLKPFVSTSFSGRVPIESAVVTISATVFEPKNLTALLASQSLASSFERETSIEVAGQERVAALLEAALGDWADFWFVPSPKPFVIYADHDEHATFFSSSKSNLNGVVEPLLKNGFKMVDYKREF